MVSILKLGLAAFFLSVNGILLPAGLNDDRQQVLDMSKESVSQINDFVYPTPPGKDQRPVPGDSPIIQCDASEAQLLNLQSVILEPNPPARGENLTIVAKGYLAEDVEAGAYVDVEVRYGFIKLIHQTFDLCEEIAKVDLECPLKAGEHVIIKQVEVPNEVPPGKYIVNARAYTKDDEFITCLTATVEFPAI